MALVDAYDKKTGKKLPYLVHEEHFSHPVLGQRIAPLPSNRKVTAHVRIEVDEEPDGKASKRPKRSPDPVTETPDADRSEDTTQTPDAGAN